jgi:type I restriction enzyme S subunit
MVLRPRPVAVVPEFLPFFMQSDLFMERALAISVGSLSPTINWKTLAAQEFALPSLPAQHRAVALLGASRRAAESAVVARESAGRLARAIISTEILGSRHPRVALSSLSTVVRGSTPRPAGDPRFFDGSFIPWITVGAITGDDNIYLEHTDSYLTEAGFERSRRLPAGTVVLSNSGFSLGVPKILAIDGCANDGVAAFLDLDARILPLYLYFALDGLTEYFRTRVAAGGDQPNLNTARIGAVEIPLPPIVSQQRVIEKLDSLVTAKRRLGVRVIGARTMAAMWVGGL